ncbi:MAG: phosphoribosylformylglycinamidine synthase subunit PurQ [Pseudomonadota bacterium]|nr:phosphoribosylformylglycinamidine synthase subunit PurQ [Pseudomonadota bacterium]
MKSAVVVFPGSNCDRDIAVTLFKVTGNKPLMLWHNENVIPEDIDLIVLPGGFTYGDYLRSGAIASTSKIISEVKNKASKGIAILGVCNGFQILTESGLLPGTLLPNKNLKFICKDVNLRVEENNSIFTKKFDVGEIINIPIAHHDGNYFVTEDELNILKSENLIALSYCDSNGKVHTNSNPNGSIENIAGVFSNNKRVLGMMPHPERLADIKLGGTDGFRFFSSLLEDFS